MSDLAMAFYLLFVRLVVLRSLMMTDCAAAAAPSAARAEAQRVQTEINEISQGALY
jgi:hypothetical protein